MKWCLLAFTILSSSLNLIAQNELAIDQACNGSTSYGKYATNIDSIEQLPHNILLNAQHLLKRQLGKNYDNITFSHGQEVDLAGYFSDKTKPITHEWVVPRYDLVFIYQNTLISINSYCLELRLDEYCQLVKLNWPTQGYTNSSKFQSLNEIANFAVSQANIRGFNSEGYTCELKYREKSDSMNWIFSFPEGDNSNFNVLEVDMNSLKVVREYLIKRVTVN